jgi:AmiR/NasT family two-component response regulator
MYGRAPAAFGVADRANALLLASFAGLALSSAEAHAEDARRFETLQVALVSREIIGQAQGILMERERLTALEAFAILRRSSQHLNRKLNEVAQDLIDTGEQPRTSKEPPSS